MTPVSYYLLPLSDGTISAGVSYSDHVPDGAAPCTKDQYTNSANYAVENGVIVDRVVPEIPLSATASDKLTEGKAYVNSEFLVYGEAVPTAWIDYLKALREISDGTDTASTTLPLSPTEQAAQTLTPAQQVQKALLALGVLLEEKQELGIYFTPTGTTIPLLFSTSAHAQDQYNGANTFAKENPDTPQNFITDSGAPVVLTADDVIKLTNGVAGYINDTNATYATLVKKVTTDYTTDITVGWPDNKLPS